MRGKASVQAGSALVLMFATSVQSGQARPVQSSPGCCCGCVASLGQKRRGSRVHDGVLGGGGEKGFVGCRPSGREGEPRGGNPSGREGAAS